MTRSIDATDSEKSRDPHRTPEDFPEAVVDGVDRAARHPHGDDLLEPLHCGALLQPLDEQRAAHDRMIG